MAITIKLTKAMEGIRKAQSPSDYNVYLYELLGVPRTEKRREIVERAERGRAFRYVMRAYNRADAAEMAVELSLRETEWFVHIDLVEKGAGPRMYADVSTSAHYSNALGRIEIHEV